MVLVGLAALWMCGCGPSLMTKVPAIDLDDPDHAIVTFVRSSIMAPTYEAELWDRETPIGELSVRSYIQYKAAPGKHLFLSKSEHFSFLEANLITGEHYVVKIEVIPGGNAPRLVLTPISPRTGDVERSDVEKWLRDLKAVRMDASQGQEYVEPRIHAVREAIALHDAGGTVFENLYAEDFWPKSN